MIVITFKNDQSRRCQFARWWSNVAVVVVTVVGLSLGGNISPSHAFPVATTNTNTMIDRSVSLSFQHDERPNILQPPLPYSTAFRRSRIGSSSSSSSSSLHMLSPSSQDDEEWHPNDPAWTTPQLLEGIWSQIAQAKNMVRNVRMVQCTVQIYTPNSSFVGAVVHDFVIRCW